MRNSTRKLFVAFISQVALLNQVVSATEKFNVDPSIQQTLEKKIQESAEFLTKINVIPVIDGKAETLGLGVNGTIASRTNTRNGNERKPNTMGDVELINEYECAKTDFDTAIRYDKLDLWARYPSFQQMIRDMIITQQALDRIMIGFHGTHVATDTDRVAYPNLEDLNIGWLEKYRQNAPDRVMNEGATPGSTIKIGATGDYKNLDALVIDMVNNLIDPIYRKNGKLVVLIGQNMVNDKMFPLVNDVDKPTEIVAAQVLLGQGRLGGLQPVSPPFFPDDTIMITSLDNLSIYWQEGARRRQIEDEPKLDRIVNYESSNDAYVIENYAAGCIAENIEIQ